MPKVLQTDRDLAGPAWMGEVTDRDFRNDKVDAGELGAGLNRLVNT